MAGVKALITLALTASIGLLFLILACALPQFSNWTPFWVTVFYILLPLPTLMAKRHKHEERVKDLAGFLTAGIVVSAFALPIVMSRAPVVTKAADLSDVAISTIVPPAYVISGGACFLVMLSNTIIFLTIYGFFKIFDDDNDF